MKKLYLPDDGDSGGLATLGEQRSLSMEDGTRIPSTE